MTISALIFGGIGAMIETSQLQRQAFNLAFERLNIDFVWSQSAYRDSLSLTGGALRLGQIVLGSGGGLSAAQLSAVHGEKTRLFGDLLSSQTLPLRAGVESLIEAASRLGVPLAWATTTSDANIDAIITASGGLLRRPMFSYLGNDQAIARQKPNPEIYYLALMNLGVQPGAALAIEDSPTGVSAAKAAGIRTIAFPGTLNIDKDFSEADGVTFELSSVLLGDGDFGSVAKMAL
jgi:beta-phosphoglucomutase-like phosphatase (HAD superfamily)